MDLLKLRNSIPSTVFDYQILSDHLKERSHPRRDIANLIHRGHIIQIKKGLYAWGKELNLGDAIPLEQIANIVYTPSYVSLEYALSYRNLIPERVDQITSVTTKRKHLRKTPVGVFSYEPISTAAFPYGVEWEQVGRSATALIARSEKALLDLVFLRTGNFEITSQNLGDFLFDDLRIDEDKFYELDFTLMRKYSRFYRREHVAKFIKAIGVRNE